MFTIKFYSEDKSVFYGEKVLTSVEEMESFHKNGSKLAGFSNARWAHVNCSDPKYMGWDGIWYEFK